MRVASLRFFGDRTLEARVLGGSATSRGRPGALRPAVTGGLPLSGPAHASDVPFFYRLPKGSGPMYGATELRSGNPQPAGAAGAGLRRRAQPASPRPCIGGTPRR